MDFGVAALFFAVGLGGALILSNLSKWRRQETGMEGLLIKDGSVRMDLMVGKSRPGRRGREEAGELAGSSDPVVPSGPLAPEESESAVPRRARARRKKR